MVGRPMRAGVAALAFASAIIALFAIFAACAVTAPAAPSVATGPLEVQIWPEELPEGAAVIIGTKLAPSVRLPATVRLPLPEGLKVDWAGEVSPSDPASDVAREFTIGSASNGRYVEFQVSQYRDAQVDLSAQPVRVDGGVKRVTLRFVQSVPASETGFSVKVPAGFELKDAEPDVSGRPATSPAGESLYALETQSLKPGQALDVSVTYRLRAPVTPASRANALIFALAAAAFTAFAVLLFVVWRQQAARRHAGGS